MWKKVYLLLKQLACIFSLQQSKWECERTSGKCERRRRKRKCDEY